MIKGYPISMAYVYNITLVVIIKKSSKPSCQNFECDFGYQLHFWSLFLYWTFYSFKL